MMTQSGTVEPGNVEAGVEELQAFRSRRRVRIPEELREGAPVPETWPYGRESWEVFAEAAREHSRLKPVHDFAYRIGLLGYFPDELAKGQLRHGAEVNVLTGRVVRHWAAYDDATMKRARELKHQLARDRAPLAPILMGDLEAIGQGREVGSEKRLRIVLEAAESALRQRQAEVQAATQEEAARPLLLVRFHFKAMGREYQQGEYRISPEEADQLTVWMDRMLNQAAQHSWDAPSGFSPDSWPPFSLEAPRLDY